MTITVIPRAAPLDAADVNILLAAREILRALDTGAPTTTGHARFQAKATSAADAITAALITGKVYCDLEVCIA